MRYWTNCSRITVLSLLPETAASLDAVCSLGQEDITKYLQTWQQAIEARLKLPQLTPAQLGVVEGVMARLLPQAGESQGDSPNLRGTALYLLCADHPELEERLV